MSLSSKCSRCEKTVYVTEELHCLDKVWHKSCFKCQECGMVLNLKTYKGYNKLPYCNAHIPKVTHTALSDTVESRRLAEITKIQSNVKYHADFEKLKGKVTQVADDVEILRACHTSKIVSNVAYHGEIEKKKRMENSRNLLSDTNGVNQCDKQTKFGQQVKNSLQPTIMTGYQPVETPMTKNQVSTSYQPSYQMKNHILSSEAVSSTTVNYAPNQNHNNFSLTNAAAISQPSYQKMNLPSFSATQSTLSYPSNQNITLSADAAASSQQTYQVKNHLPYSEKLPLTKNYQSIQTPNNSSTTFKDSFPQPSYQKKNYSPYSDKLQPTVIYTSNQGPVTDSQVPKVGSIADYDPMDEMYNKVAPYFPEGSRALIYELIKQKMTCVALYDYTAQDHDEVSFVEGDLIVDSLNIDEGWMYGRIKRTGLDGLIPVNYVVPEYEMDYRNRYR